MTSSKKSVVLLCGDYMEDFEAMVPFQALQAYGISVDAVCPGKKAGDICRTAIHQNSQYQNYSEARGHNFILNANYDEIEASKYDGIVIPGGRAPEYLAMDKSVQELVKSFANSGKLIATVCHSQLILAAADLLKGRECTAYPALKPVLISAGANWVEADTLAKCHADANLITAATYMGHREHINHIIKALGGTITGSDKKILFLCGDYMEDYEVVVPFQALQALGCHVDAVCPNKGAGDICATAVHDFEGDQTYSEKPGHLFTLTASFKGVDASGYDALVIPGGRAPEYLALDESILKLVKEFMEARKPVASICHGHQILSAAGVLKVLSNLRIKREQTDAYITGFSWRKKSCFNGSLPAQKQETPTVKVDMEAKLRSWLESKGKTKSSLKYGAYENPSISRTPMSASRNKKLNSSLKPKTVSNQSASNCKERTLIKPRNLYNRGDLAGPVSEVPDVVATKTIAPVNSVLQPNACTPEPKAQDTKNTDSTGTSPINRKLEALQDSFRKVLSPICSNMNIKNVSSTDQMCLVLYDPKTPKTPQVCQNDMFQENATPLGRYTAQSSKLKNFLVQQYVDLLNTASKDELLELKGIGEKIAEYILELRESSPIKSLNDLEKIGLSSKQVNNMFGRAAKGLLD